MNFTSESLEQVLINLSQAIDGVGERIAVRPTKLIVWRGALRQAIFVMHSKHKAHLMPFKQRKATRIIYDTEVGDMNDDDFMLGWIVGMLTCFVILKLTGAI